MPHIQPDEEQMEKLHSILQADDGQRLYVWVEVEHDRRSYGVTTLAEGGEDAREPYMVIEIIRNGPTTRLANVEDAETFKAIDDQVITLLAERFGIPPLQPLKDLDGTFVNCVHYTSFIVDEVEYDILMEFVQIEDDADELDEEDLEDCYTVAVVGEKSYEALPKTHPNYERIVEQAKLAIEYADLANEAGDNVAEA